MMEKSGIELLLIFGNASFLLFGIAGIISGTMMTFDAKKFLFFATLDALFDVASAFIINIGYAIVAVSCLALIISAIGFAGVFTHKKILIVVYACLLVTVIILELCGIVLLDLFLKKHLERSKKEAFNLTVRLVEQKKSTGAIHLVKKEGEGTKASFDSLGINVNVMQKKLKCCGVDGPRDYDPNGSIIPMSCGEYILYTKGCDEKIMDAIEEKHDPVKLIKKTISDVQHKFKDIRERYGKKDHRGYTNVVDFIQKKWKCCGKEGPKDYEDANILLPISCGIPEYTKGCHEKIKELDDPKNLEEKSKKRATFKTLLWSFFHKNDYNSTFKENMDTIQREELCCGIDGPKDYDPASVAIPKSCSNYTIGCVDKLLEWVNRNKIIFVGTTIGFSLLQLGLFICTICLYRTKRKEDRTIIDLQVSKSSIAKVSSSSELKVVDPTPAVSRPHKSGIRRTRGKKKSPSGEKVNSPSMEKVNSPSMEKVSHTTD